MVPGFSSLLMTAGRLLTRWPGGVWKGNGSRGIEDGEASFVVSEPAWLLVRDLACWIMVLKCIFDGLQAVGCRMVYDDSSVPKKSRVSQEILDGWLLDFGLALSKQPGTRSDADAFLARQETSMELNRRPTHHAVRARPELFMALKNQEPQHGKRSLEWRPRPGNSHNGT